MSILIACFCVVTPGAEKGLTSADRVALRTRLIFVSILRYWTKLFRVFNSTLKLLRGLLPNSEFFGVESKTENDQDFSKKSQSELVKNSCFWCPWTQEPLNIWEIHMLHTLQERQHERGVQMRLKSFWGQKWMAFLMNAWFMTASLYLLCPHVFEAEQSDSKNQKRRCFQKDWKNLPFVNNQPVRSALVCFSGDYHKCVSAFKQMWRTLC